MSNFAKLIGEAQQLLMAGDFRGSLDACEKCMKLDANSTLPWQLAGTIYGKTGNFSAAEKCFRKVTGINPTLADAWYYLAVALVYQGNTTDEVLASFRKSVELNRNFAPGWVGLGNLLRDRGRLDEAIEAFESAANADPGSAEPLLSLGFMHRNSGQYLEALGYFERALALHPAQPAGTAAKASVLFRLGRKAESLELIAATVSTGGRNMLVAQAYAEIADSHEMARNALEYIEAVLDKEQLVQIQANELLFSAARLSDRIGEYDRAFAYLKKANAYRARQFNLERHRDYIRCMQTLFTEESILGMRHSEKYNKVPIFIVGMPRSGSTLVEQILSRHPDVLAGGELTLLPDLVASTCEMDAHSPDIPRCLAALNPCKTRLMADAYQAAVTALSATASHITDKLPTNYERLGLIAAMIPEAKIIYTRRNPLDTCLSCYFQNFGNNHTYIYDMDKLAEVYKLHEQLLGHWHSISCIDIFDFHYEELVEHPEKTIRGLLQHCGLSWSDRCLDFHKSDRIAVTASYDQVRQALYKKSVGRWKHYEKHLASLRKALENAEPPN